MEPRDQSVSVETLRRPDAERRTTGFWADEGLQQFTASSVQATQLQELQQYLRPVVDTPSLQHSTDNERRGTRFSVLEARHGRRLQILRIRP